MTFFISCWRLWAWLCNCVARRLHRWAIRSIISRVFLCLIQRGGIGDPLAALLTREGIADEMRGADKALLHRGRCLDGDQLIHECLVDTATKLAEGLGEHKGHLRARGLVRTQATGVHHGKIRAQTVADVLIRPPE